MKFSSEIGSVSSWHWPPEFHCPPLPEISSKGYEKKGINARERESQREGERERER